MYNNNYTQSFVPNTSSNNTIGKPKQHKDRSAASIAAALITLIPAFVFCYAKIGLNQSNTD